MEEDKGQAARKLSHYSRKRVVIVDDSRTIRSWLRHVLESDPRLDVVGEADCALTARQIIKQMKPDVITLDIEMPGMSGLDFLEKVMSLHPLPVVMISGATKSNSEATVTALSLGAVDCILKPTSVSDPATMRDIARRVFAAACSTAQVMRRQPPLAAATSGRVPPDRMPIILIGASTGGVAALETVLADLHLDCPPVVVVQHMPGAFLASFAQKLNRQLAQDVAVAREGEALSYGQIRLAPSQGRHTQVQRRGGTWQCRFTADASGALHCPSVDILFHSAVSYAPDVIAGILTGLGRDGAQGLLELRRAGADTIGQDGPTSVIYGMPRAAFELGAVQTQLPLDQIGEALNRAVRLHAGQQGVVRP